MTEPPADHFSAAAPDYARFRPRYPASLFDYLASLVTDRDLAWDCATGTGQAVAPLVARFRHVVASDVSFAQVTQANRPPGVTFFVARAERVPLRDDCVSLVTVGQALHWFDRAAFFAEVRRILRPDGILSAWTYNLCTVDGDVDSVVNVFYRDILRPYWPPERSLVEDSYDAIAFPFASTAVVTMQMSAHWTVEELLSYLGTWSAVKRYRDARHEDPVDCIRATLREAWGAIDRRSVSWPLCIRTARR